jgi:hypothetical protein
MWIALRNLTTLTRSILLVYYHYNVGMLSLSTHPTLTELDIQVYKRDG